MKIINFGIVNIKLLIPVFGGIARLIYIFLIHLNPKYEIVKKNPFILNIYTSIGMIFSFIPFLIFKYRSKSKTESKTIDSEVTQNESKLTIELIHSDAYEEIELNKRNKYKLIVCSGIFDFLQVLLLTVFCIYCDYNLWIFDNFFMCLFSYLILKTKIYKHQCFSMFIIIILGLVLNSVKYFNTGNKLDPLELSMKLLSEICLSLGCVIVKYNLETTYCSPYEICLWEGFLGLILNIIILIVINQLKVTISGIEYPNNFYELFDNYDINDFIVCIGELLMNAIYNIVLFVTCDYFTPIHILITYIIKEFYSYLRADGNLALNILGIFILILIGFMFLIFVEIIELNICNLSFNTKKNIELRSTAEDSFEKEKDLNPQEEMLIDEGEMRNTSFASSDGY